MRDHKWQFSYAPLKTTVTLTLKFFLFYSILFSSNFLTNQNVLLTKIKFFRMPRTKRVYSGKTITGVLYPVAICMLFVAINVKLSQPEQQEQSKVLVLILKILKFLKFAISEYTDCSIHTIPRIAGQSLCIWLDFWFWRLVWEFFVIRWSFIR